MAARGGHVLIARATRLMLPLLHGKVAAAAVAEDPGKVGLGDEPFVCIDVTGGNVWVKPSA
jgi:hypothetical protein